MSITMSQATSTHHVPIYKIVRRVAKKLEFSAEEIKDMHIYVAGTNDINAYTNSITSKNINIVIFDGLLSLMTPEEAEAVIAHELGHVKSGHVPASLLLSMIFQSTGEILIPEDKAFQSLAKALTTDFLVRSLSFSSRTSVSNMPAEMESYVNDLNQGIESIIYDLKAKTQKDFKRKQQLLDLVYQISNSAQHPFLNAVGEPENADDAKTADVLLKSKDFKKAMVELTRAFEVTADRFGIYGSSPKMFISSMAKLTGGKTADPEKLLQQVKNTISAGEDLSSYENNDHPLTLFRIGYANAFPNSNEGKILLNPLSRVVVTYLVVTEKLKKAVSLISEDRMTGEVVSYLALREEFGSILSQLSHLITEEIISDLSSSYEEGRPMESFRTLISTLEKIEESSKYSSLIDKEELVKPGRLIYELGQKLESMEDNSYAKTALDILDNKFYITSNLNKLTAIDRVATERMKDLGERKLDLEKICRSLFKAK